VRDQLVIHSDFSLPERHRLLDELAAQRMLVSQRLKLAPTSQPIDVYLFDTAADYDQFVALRYPEFPKRRAFFVQTEGRLVVYAHWNERVAEDLRHEVCHGYLHAALESLPLWLDEGLAEYFEIPSGGQGFNAPHVRELAAAIREENWRPDLKRLEAIAPNGSMTQRDYAESCTRTCGRWKPVKSRCRFRWPCGNITISPRKRCGSLSWPWRNKWKTHPPVARLGRTTRRYCVSRQVTPLALSALCCRQQPPTAHPLAGELRPGGCSSLRLRQA
jgi:hypothetical protein